MTIGPEARRWLLSNHGKTGFKTYSSRHYSQDQSWSKASVWWLKVPLIAIEKNLYDYVNLVCQKSPGEAGFFYLKVPTAFFRENIRKFHLTNEQISLYLSTEEHKLFIEERGQGNLDFSKFLV